MLGTLPRPALTCHSSSAICEKSLAGHKFFSYAVKSKLLKLLFKITFKEVFFKYSLKYFSLKLLLL